MSKFKKQLKIIEEALLKPMSIERENEIELEKPKIRLDDIKRRSILNSDGLYDVEGNVDLTNMNLTELPMKFGKVNQSFFCDHNQLTTLDGAPTYVGGYFNCEHNQLTSLEGAPKEVQRNFECHHNAVKFTKEDVEKICNVKYGVIYV